MSLASFFPWLTRGKRASRPQGFVPELTVLEDRSVPSATRSIPFKISGAGFADQGLPVQIGVAAPHDATGTATHLGKYTAEGMFQLNSFDGAPAVAGALLTGTFSSAQSVKFVAANGDTLAFSYAGTFAVFPAAGGKVYAVFVATFTPVPQQSTGRFTKYDGGSFVMTATTQPFTLGATDSTGYSWVGIGTIAFTKEKK